MALYEKQLSYFIYVLVTKLKDMIGVSFAEEARKGKTQILDESVPRFPTSEQGSMGGWVFSHAYHSVRGRLTYNKYTSKNKQYTIVSSLATDRGIDQCYFPLLQKYLIPLI